MKLPAKYRVLEYLANVGDKFGNSVLPLKQVIQNTFPEMSAADMRSVLDDLKREDLIAYAPAMDAGVYNFGVECHARSVLISLRESLQNASEEKHDARRWQMKSMIIGYALGFVSGVGIMLLRKFLFG